MEHPGAPTFTPVEVSGRVRVDFAVDPQSDDPIGRWLLTEGHLDEPPLRLVLDLLAADPDGGLVDLGAHLGSYSLPAAALGHPVIAIEAFPDAAALLRAAAAHNGLSRLRVFNAIAGDSPESRRVVPAGVGAQILSGDADRSGARMVPGLTVDDAIAQTGWDGVAVVKLDIEGWEAHALAGMERLLSSAEPPAMVIEINIPMLEFHGSSADAVIDILRGHGCRLFLIDRVDEGRLVEHPAAGVQVDGVAEYLACRSLPPGLAAWRFTPPFTADEVVDRLLTAGVDAHAPYRRHVARVIRELPPALAGHPELVGALRALELDQDDEVRAEASGREAVITEPQPVGSAAR
jgi:FkbM family methyltransferase